MNDVRDTVGLDTSACSDHDVFTNSLNFRLLAMAICRFVHTCIKKQSIAQSNHYLLSFYSELLFIGFQRKLKR